MAKARFERCLSDSGLLRINFPGVKIKAERLLVLLHKTLDQVFAERIRVEPEITTATDRKIGSECLIGWNGNFNQTLIPLMNKSWPVRIPVMIVPDRIGAAAERKTQAMKNIECPQICVIN